MNYGKVILVIGDDVTSNACAQYAISPVCFLLVRAQLYSFISNGVEVLGQFGHAFGDTEIWMYPLLLLRAKNCRVAYNVISASGCAHNAFLTVIKVAVC